MRLIVAPLLLLCFVAGCVRPSPTPLRAPLSRPPASKLEPLKGIEKESIERIREADRLSQMGNHEEAARSLTVVTQPHAPERARKYRELETVFWARAGRLNLAYESYVKIETRVADEDIMPFAVFLRGKLSEWEWQQVVPTGAPSTIAAGAVLALEAERMAVQDLPGAEEKIDQALAFSELEGSVRERLTRIRQAQVQESSSMFDKLGVVLPLSGVHRHFGQRVIQALQMAMVEVQTELQLVVTDSRGDAERAGMLIDELARDEGIGAILGPVGSHETAEAVRVAAEYAVPLLHLSVNSSLPYAGQCIFQLRLTHSMETLALLQHAVAELHAERFAILWPETRYGQSMHESFQSWVETMGGILVADVSFSPDTRDFREIARELAGGPKHLRGEPPFDVLFLPMDVADGKRLLPYLRSVGFVFRTQPSRSNAVQLMATKRWHVADVYDRAEGNTENVIFSAAFDSHSQAPTAQWFVTRFEERYLKAPQGFDAEAYDSSMVLLEAMKRSRSQGGDRLSVCRILRDSSPREGSTGLLSFSATGNAIREVFLMTLHGETVRPRRSEAEEQDLREPSTGGRGGSEN